MVEIYTMRMSAQRVETVIRALEAQAHDIDELDDERADTLLVIADDMKQARDRQDGRSAYGLIGSNETDHDERGNPI